MEGVLKAFLEISLAASAMICIVLMIRMLLSKKMSPAVMLLLWGMVLLRLMLPLTFSSPVQLSDLFPRQTYLTDTNNGLISTGDQVSGINSAASNNSNPSGTNMEPSNGQETPQVPNEAAPTKPADITLADLLKHIRWWNVLAAVWMTGIVAILLLTVWKAARFRRKLMFCNPVADKGILDFIQVHKKETGVRKAVAALECDFVNAPAVFGYFKPFILIPSRFLEGMDRGSLNTILLHEIYHIRCHDILKNYIWLAAKALHWFNPLVWLAYKLFEDDVELRRDQKVAHMLEADGAFIYSRSLLEAARFSRQAACMPSSATALFENKCKLRQRIVRLVKPQRRTKFAAIVSALLAVLMIIACFTTACQPTPKTPVVVGRQEDILSNVTSVPSSDFNQIETPEHISEVHDDFPYLKITYDADIVVPETTAYPVTEVTKRNFSNEEILAFIKLLAGRNDEFYTEWNLSKDDYLQKLTKAKKYKGTERVTKEDIERLQEIYEKAPVKVENPVVNSVSELRSFNNIDWRGYIKNGYQISTVVFPRNGNFFSYARDELNTAVYAASSVADNLYTQNMDGTIEHFKWLRPGEPEISREDAYDQALACANAMGADLDLCDAEPCSFITNLVDKTTGWQFTFTRKIAGLQTMKTIGSTSWSNENPPSYGSPWGEEKLVISVDKNGIFSLFWRGASTISRKVAESAQLKDFNTIHQRITDQLSYKYAEPVDGKSEKIEIEILEIRLGISMISMENRTDVGEYLPTWYVSYRYKGENENKNAWTAQQIMFSAIDGSYIEPRISNTVLMGLPPDPNGSSSESSG